MRVLTQHSPPFRCWLGFTRPEHYVLVSQAIKNGSTVSRVVWPACRPSNFQSFTGTSDTINKALWQRIARKYAHNLIDSKLREFCFSSVTILLPQPRICLLVLILPIAFPDNTLLYHDQIIVANRVEYSDGHYSRDAAALCFGNAEKRFWVNNTMCVAVK